MINEGCSIRTDTGRHQVDLDHTLSKLDFWRGTEIYILPNKDRI